MRFFVASLFLLTALVTADEFRGRPELDGEWASFKTKHKKGYKNATEESTRRSLWEANLDKIASHNKDAAVGKYTYTMKENHMSDWTAEEKKKLLGVKVKLGRQDGNVGYLIHELERQSVPALVDLRTCPCMTPIQNQGNCGSSWAFPPTAAMEYRFCKRAGGAKAIKLSEQQLLDCVYYATGCQGGRVQDVWAYVQKAPGQAAESDYPLVYSQSAANGFVGYCGYRPVTAAGTIKGYAALPRSNLTAIQSVLSKDGTLVASLHVVDSFFTVGSGIYSDTSCASDGSTVNHAVAIVGYGTLNNVAYWIVRNSWGTSWGNNGYFFIRRGVNMCNIESFINYPLV